ncbi:hypothetical protein [Mycobacteroides immunogenum]|uniref:Uncharacterized protein n=1 Tax=Mycobacteroides immunogenum TaxID=83262 RepID=A0A7V8RUQ5_9MYCO|nr:hypothetical protein [Mycobacteroides immunogenum]AMT72139.1 hypothetical protein ABG82_19410 [Mycobacteroides immunogenum]ANO05269.1 hypothetical protein BAB75_19665 [Mycobacteroides immunogenum]KIU37998.1 hypothetical protein TL11_24865 [Mycobacteroides immunogenum]KPG04218.1 hypothetical protein AN909_23355 [Mycobacteroides immunogenum]KPG04865.1 hypothetical protein AN908_23855 [Mycobacteroides immunogenum]
MGFGPNPADVRAAEIAAREARDRLTSKPLTPFETELLAVLGEIRDALKAAGNSAGAVTGSGDGGGTSRRRQLKQPDERSKQCACGRQVYLGSASRRWVHIDDATPACEVV